MSNLDSSLKSITEDNNIKLNNRIRIDGHWCKEYEKVFDGVKYNYTNFVSATDKESALIGMISNEEAIKVLPLLKNIMNKKCCILDE